MLKKTDEERRARNKRKARRRAQRAKNNNPQPVNFDAFRRLKFEAELRACVNSFRDKPLARSVLAEMRRALKSVVRKYARSRQLGRRFDVRIGVDMKRETIEVKWFFRDREIQWFDAYDAVNPGSRKIVGMHVGPQGERTPVMAGEPVEHPPTALGQLLEGDE